MGCSSIFEEENRLNTMKKKYGREMQLKGIVASDEQEYRRNRRNRHRHRNRHREEGFGPVPVMDYWGFCGTGTDRNRHRHQHWHKNGQKWAKAPAPAPEPGHRHRFSTDGPVPVLHFALFRVRFQPRFGPVGFGSGLMLIPNKDCRCNLVNIDSSVERQQKGKKPIVLEVNRLEAYTADIGA
ncbi:hypothetical protein LXL04_004641 [Taraxacum kok-saghyz]